MNVVRHQPAGDEDACAKTRDGITSPANQDLRAIRILLLFVWPRFWEALLEMTSGDRSREEAIP